MKPTNPPRLPKPPHVEVFQRISASYENGMLTIQIPIRINGFDLAIPADMDVRQIPDDVWRQMQSARSKLILPSIGPVKH